MTQNENCSCTGMCALFSFFLGGLIGAGVTLLVAPKSGKETRQQLKGLAEEVKGKAETYIDEVKGEVVSVVKKGKELVEKGKGLLEDERNILASAVEAGKDAFGKEKEKDARE